MDSVSQLALGAAVGVAVMGRRTSLVKAAGWGAVLGTLPDLDVFIDHGDPMLNMVLHRAESHALFWLTLCAPLFGAGIARLHGEWPLWRRWWLAVWLVLITHPLLDTLTIYGTQLAIPFSNHPYGVGSVFVIDPLYTLPLLLGLGCALAGRRRPAFALRANAIGLALSTAYLLWGIAVQQHVRSIAQASLTRQGVQAQALLVTPTAFNSVLWRVVATTSTHYHEGFYSLLDAQAEPLWETHQRGAELMQAYAGHPSYERLNRFAKGLVAMQAVDGRAHLSDLRMGQTPNYTFSFDIGPAAGPGAEPQATQARGRRPELSRALPWLWARLLGDPLPPPR
ncbi:MAG: metal-dependent hydrolase [Hylemonella sp.]|uniref:metal-dependent hydrolase n=1 Tax=Hylemonella sp. TaxID=2066020 RepID=UPI0022BDF000|nr:metal-dependent hydrolase [Hylemonella sp.]MCZ8251403.1 metal-dependent hydrolase [Hylemonella sp.]